MERSTTSFRGVDLNEHSLSYLKKKLKLLPSQKHLTLVNMDQINAIKFANKLLDSFVDERKYVKVDVMRDDLVALLRENESKAFVDDYDLKDKMLSILIVNGLKMGGDSDFHFSNRLDKLLRDQFEEKKDCTKCKKTKIKSDLSACKKCKKLFCLIWCGRHIKVGSNYIFLCDVCANSELF